MTEIAIADDDSKMRYQIAEREAQQRVDQLATVGDGVQSADIAIARFIIENAMEEGKPSLAAKVLDSLPKLASAKLDHDRRHGSLIPRSDVIRLAQIITGCVADVFGDLPDFDTRSDDLNVAVARAIESLAQEDHE